MILSYLVRLVKQCEIVVGRVIKSPKLAYVMLWRYSIMPTKCNCYPGEECEGHAFGSVCLSVCLCLSVCRVRN